MELEPAMGKTKSEALERDFQRWLRRRYRLFNASVEYGLGGDPGFSDMVMSVRTAGQSGVVVVPTFVELKIGRIIGESKDVLACSEVRTDQAMWHSQARRAGWRTAFLVGVGMKENWDIYAIRAEHIHDLRFNYNIGNQPHLGDAELVAVENLEDWLRKNT